MISRLEATELLLKLLTEKHLVHGCLSEDDKVRVEDHVREQIAV